MTLNPDGSIIDADFDKPGWSEQTGWVGPSWVGDGGATLVSGPIQVGNEDVVQHTPGDESNGIPDAISRWFSDPSAKGMADLRLEFADVSPAQEEKIIELMFTEPDAWTHRPLSQHPFQSLLTVVYAPWRALVLSLRDDELEADA